MPGGDLVRFVLAEEHTERRVDTGSGRGARPTATVARIRVDDPLRLCEQPGRLHHRVVAADQHAERVRLLGPGVRRHGVVDTGDLEGVTSS